jgi:thiamine transport system permease protein
MNAATLRRTAVAAVPVVFVGLLFVIPVAAVLDTGLRTANGWQFAAAVDAATDVRTWRVLMFTVAQAALSSAVTMALGLPLAYVLARYRFRGAALLRSLVLVPFVLPTVVVGAAFLALVGPRGVLGVDLSGTMAALLAAHAFLNLAVVVRTVGAVLAQLDPAAEDAARTLGATRWKAFTTVTLPAIAPAVITSAVVVGLFCFTSFGVVQVLGAGRLRTVEVEIYRAVAVDLDLVVAATLALLQLVCVLVLLVGVERLQRRRGTPGRQLDPALVRRAPRGVAETVAVRSTAVIGAVLMLAPLLVLVLRSVRVGDTWSLAGWRSLFTDTGSTAFVDPGRALVVSFGTAAVAATVALLVGGSAAIAVSRGGGSRSMSGVDAFLLLPLGTSAVTIGLGLFLAFDTPPLDLRGSWWLLPLAQALVAAPFVTRVLAPAMRSYDRRLLDAGAVLGATPAVARRTLAWPLLRPVVAVAGGFAFAVALGEFGATAFLARADAPTLPVAIARLLSRPGELLASQAYAASVLLMGVVVLVVVGTDRVRTARAGEF